MLATTLGFAATETQNATWLLLILYGAAIAFTDSVSNAFVADLVPFDKRATALGLQHTVLGIAILPSNIIFGFVAQTISTNAAFYVLSAFGLTATALLLCCVTEKK